MISNKSTVEILQLKLIVSLIMSLRSFGSFLVRSAINNRPTNPITQQLAKQQLNFVKVIANNQFYQPIKQKSTYKSKSPKDKSNKSSRSSSKSPSKSKSTSTNPSKSEPSKKHFDSKSNSSGDRSFAHQSSLWPLNDQPKNQSQDSSSSYGTYKIKNDKAKDQSNDWSKVSGNKSREYRDPNDQLKDDQIINKAKKDDGKKKNYKMWTEKEHEEWTDRLFGELKSFVDKEKNTSMKILDAFRRKDLSQIVNSMSIPQSNDLKNMLKQKLTEFEKGASQKMMRLENELKEYLQKNVCGAKNLEDKLKVSREMAEKGNKVIEDLEKHGKNIVDEIKKKGAEIKPKYQK